MYRHKHYPHHHRHYISEEVKASLFTTFLLIFVLACIITATAHSGPIVLGTERNGDGSVEYLCLGTGCEDLRPMDW